MLVVIRGNKKTCDPNYRCAIHDSSFGKYGILNLDENGTVLERKCFANTDDIYSYINSNPKDVYMDERPSKNLLPKLKLPHSYNASNIIRQCRQSKSEQEKKLLENIHDKTMQIMKNTTSDIEFRNSAKVNDCKSFAEITEYDDFTQRRFGLQDKGLCSDICDAIPKNHEWSMHISNSKKNLVKIKSEIIVGNTIESIEEKFRAAMEKDGLEIHDSTIYGIGYESLEDVGDTIEKDQVYSIFVRFTPNDDSSKKCMIKTLALPISRKEEDVNKNIVQEKQYKGIYTETGVFGLNKNLDFNIAHIFLGFKFISEEELQEKSKYLKNDPRLVKSGDAPSVPKVVSRKAVLKFS